MLSHFSRVGLCATPWTVAFQAPLSIGILQARILDLPDPGIKPTSLRSLALGSPFVLPTFGQMFCVFVLFTQVIWKAVNSVFTGLMVIAIFQKVIAPVSLHQCQERYQPWWPSPGKVTDLYPCLSFPLMSTSQFPRFFLIQLWLSNPS